MKKVQISLALVAVSMGVSIFLTSCKKEKGGDEPLTDTILSGEITADKTLTADQTWYLRGDVHVKAPATLTIEAGTTIIAQTDVITYLLIEQGAKINAVGTASNPIIFTADVKESGAWGSIHICGKAPINVTGGTGSSEIGEATYGGTVSDDNSGTMKYCRLEYTGQTLDEEHEANGLTLYGVGSATTLEYIQIYKGDDDGIEFFGGTAQLKYAMVYGAGDDCFDWTQGWSGKGQYWLAIKAPNDGDRGIEADNNSSNNAATPFANPTLSQVTIIGQYALIDSAGKAGVKLREGTKGKINNMVVTGFDKRSVDVEHDQTLLNVVDGSLLVDYSYVNNNVNDVAFKYSASKTGEVSNDKPAGLSEKQFELSSNITLQNLITGVTKATTYTGGKDVSTTDSWFESDSKIGSGDSWLQGGWARLDF